jgi:2-polyprenyl-3-methyl-5-hydroxy-6-metoxy-1,4-benzoquinol methylase
MDQGALEIMEERQKYEKIYTTEEYRRGPFPGLQYGLMFLVRYLSGYKSMIDFGCGSGDAAVLFARLGYDVFLIDIAENCLNEEAQGALACRFWVAALHELPPDVPHVDWGYCTDVMEHLPEEWVAPSLAAIKSRTDRIFFSISGEPDGWGALIEERLHLTIQPVDWWAGEIRKHWRKVDVLKDTGKSIVIVGTME